MNSRLYWGIQFVLFPPAALVPLLHRSDGSFDCSLAPRAPWLCYSLSVSISVFLLEFPGRRLAPENNHQTAVRALDLLTHTYTLSPVYRPGLGAVMLLVHSLPRTDLVALVSELLLAILGFFITVRLVYTGTEVDCSLRCCCHITQPWKGALNSTSNYWYVALAYIFPLVEHVSCCWRRRRSQCR